MTFETSTLKVEISPFLIRFVSFMPNLKLTRGYNSEFVSLFYLYEFPLVISVLVIILFQMKRYFVETLTGIPSSAMFSRLLFLLALFEFTLEPMKAIGQ